MQDLPTTGNQEKYCPAGPTGLGSWRQGDRVRPQLHSAEPLRSALPTSSGGGCVRRGGRGVKLGAGASDIGVDPVLGMAHEQAGKQRQASTMGMERVDSQNWY